jgi:heterodisulfide reductase subunit A
MRHFTNAQITAQVDALTETEPEKKIIAFCCNWCAYAGADFAGVNRMQYPPNVRIIRTMCSGRVSPKFVEHAFSRGAGAVLVAGCHPGDCHYIDANIQTQKRVEKLWKKMERLGVDKERLQLLWASAAEGGQVASKIHEMEVKLKELTPEETRRSIEAFAESQR